MASSGKLNGDPRPRAQAASTATPARWRPGILVATAVGLLALGILIRPGQASGPGWHLAVEMVSITLAVVVGALSFVRFYAHREKVFLFIGTGFLAAGVLDAVHVFVAAEVASGGLGATVDLTAWSWIQARSFLALFLLLSAFDTSPERSSTPSEETRVYVQAAVLALTVLGFFVLAPTPPVFRPGALLARPWELMPGILFGSALIGFLVRGGWRTDVFEFWLALGLILAATAHLGFMARSTALHDSYHDAAHLLSLLSHGAVIGGLLLSLHQTFRGEAEALQIEARANQALAREVEVRREAEAVLQRSEERLQGFLESAHDLIQSTDPKGRIVYVNAAWERTLGYDRAEMSGTELATVLHPRCRRRVLRDFRRVLDGEDVDEIVAEFVSKDGASVVCSGRATRHVVDGVTVGTQSIFRDVTAQREAERELAASRANVKALVENTGDMIWSVDTEHRLVTFNSAFALATEARWGREPRVGDAPADVFGPDDAPWYADLYGRVLRGQRFSALREEPMLGQTRAYEIFCNPVHEGAGATGAVMFGRDVTRRLEAEEALRVAKEEAESANRAKSQFLANMSHELRTPLNSVIGFTNILLKNKSGTLSQKDLGFLERVLTNGRHLLALINEVLDLAKVEAGRMELELVEVDLGHLVDETVAQLEGQAREKSVRLTSALPGPLATVRTDPAKLRQVLINLIGNAMKFSEGGSVTVRLLGEPGGAPAGIAVEDTGVGIPRDRLEAIFDAFAQADQSTSRRYGGTGLGLTISRSICQLMGYELGVESTVGVGSTFTIRMAPAAPGEAAPGPGTERGLEAATPIAPESEHPLHRGGPLADRRILVVDDEDDARLVLSHHLRELGCTVLSTASGTDALEMARSERPDLVTLDLLMPDPDGFEVLHQLKSDPATRDIPVVVVSVVASERRARLDEAVAVLPKPVERDVLIRAVWSTLGRDGGPRVLLVDPDEEEFETLARALEGAGVEVRRARRGPEAEAHLADDPPDAVVVRIGAGSGGGSGVLEHLRDHPWPGGLPVVVLTDRDLTDTERDALLDTAPSVLRDRSALDRRVLGALSPHLPLQVATPG